MAKVSSPAEPTPREATKAKGAEAQWKVPDFKLKSPPRLSAPAGTLFM